MTEVQDAPVAAPRVKKSVALAGVVAGNTALCTVSRTGNDLHYRGYDILDIADACEFEEVAHLLVHGKLPNAAELAAYKAKLKAYENREAMMKRQRLTPELPPWPSTCFYPMNKKRKVGENWFLLPVAERNRLMAEHGRTGMTFGGKVTQLITASTGFDDWEWGVTLWARNPQFLKEIVYTMRFDEASARYAEFGPFYVSYVTTPGEMLDHCRIGSPAPGSAVG